jgi:hypothetical protein
MSPIKVSLAFRSIGITDSIRVPLYRQISRENLILHLSEHHGDGCPGARIRVMMQGVEEFHREISAKGYRYMRAGIEKTEWGTLETRAIDPFGISSASASE